MILKPSNKVYMYAQFGMNVSQDDVDTIKHQMDEFIKMIEGELVGQKWEMLGSNQSSKHVHNIIKQCGNKGWAILSYDMNTLHHYKAGAMSLIREAGELGVPVYFIDSESVMEMVMRGM
jgi:hypothetical protein